MDLCGSCESSVSFPIDQMPTVRSGRKNVVAIKPAWCAGQSQAPVACDTSAMSAWYKAEEPSAASEPSTCGRCCKTVSWAFNRASSSTICILWHSSFSSISAPTLATHIGGQTVMTKNTHRMNFDTIITPSIRLPQRRGDDLFLPDGRKHNCLAAD